MCLWRKTGEGSLFLHSLREKKYRKGLGVKGSLEKDFRGRAPRGLIFLSSYQFMKKGEGIWSVRTSNPLERKRSLPNKALGGAVWAPYLPCQAKRKKEPGRELREGTRREFFQKRAPWCGTPSLPY